MKHSITTTCGETFSHSDHCELAWMIFLRFGRDIEAAANGWRRMLQNSCPTEDFAALVEEQRMSLGKMKTDFQPLS